MNDVDEIDQPKLTWRWPPFFRTGSVIGAVHYAIAWSVVLTPMGLLLEIAPQGMFSTAVLPRSIEIGSYFILAFVLGQMLLALACLSIIRILPCRIPEGSYSPDSWRIPFFAVYYALFQSCVLLIFPAIRNTWLHILFLRALGAKIGAGTFVNTNWISDAHLVEIGSGTMIGWDVIIDPHSSEGGHAVFRKVKIGNGVSIGMRTIILPGCIIEDGATVGANSVVTKGQILRAGKLYVGSPARLVGD